MSSKLFGILRPRTALRTVSLGNMSHYSSSSALHNNAEQSDFLGSFFESRSLPKRAIDHFSSIDWARKTLENEQYEMAPFFPRYFNEKTGENRFFGKTVNTDTVIPHVLSLRLKDLKTPTTTTNTSVAAEDKSARPELRAQPDVICLMSLGKDLEEHPRITHGGFLGVIFDEIMRFVILLHHHQSCAPGPRNKHYTINMSVFYHAPVFVPGDILVRSRLIQREGRKWFTEAEIVDSAGGVLTSAESMWITAKEPIV